MKVSVSAAAILVLVFGGFGWWLRSYHIATATAPTLIALGAAGIACFAGFQAFRSANASAKSSAVALRNEERAKYGWSITVHPDGDRYVLRNTGTLLARDVTLAADERTFIHFENHDGDQGPDIPPSQSKAFTASFTMMSNPGNEIKIDWLPNGEKKRRTHFDVLDEIPNKVFDETVKRRAVERDAEAAMRRQWCAEIRRHLIDLADAWGDFQAKATPQNRMRVQALVGALPSNIRTPDVMKGRGLRSSWVPGGCWGCHVQHDVGGPYV